MKSVQILSFFWSVFSPNAGKYVPERTPYLDTFHTVNVFCNVNEGLFDATIFFLVSQKGAEKRDNWSIGYSPIFICDAAYKVVVFLIRIFRIIFDLKQGRLTQN